MTRTFRDILAQIFRNLWAHKLRSFLTMFGIAWGVGSLLLLVGVGEGFRSGNKRELAEFGKDIMFLFPGRAPAVAGNMNSARSYLLTYQDYLDIRQAGNVRNAAPIISRGDLKEVSEFATASGEILGTEPNLNDSANSAGAGITAPYTARWQGQITAAKSATGASRTPENTLIAVADIFTLPNDPDQ